MALAPPFIVDRPRRARAAPEAACYRLDIAQQLSAPVGAAVRHAVSRRSRQVLRAAALPCPASSSLSRRWTIARLVLLHIKTKSCPEAVRCACCVLLFLAMGSVAHPAANRNALEFFRAMVEGDAAAADAAAADAAAADAAAVVAPMLIKLCACSRLLACRS